MEPSTEIRLRAFKGKFCMKARPKSYNSHFGLIYYLK